MRILFVCTGNTCRSPMAAAYFKDLCEKGKRHGVHVDSAGTHAGTGALVPPEARKIMARYGIDLSGHRSKPLDKQMLQKADLIVAMTSSHRLSIGAVDSHALAKTRLLLEFNDGQGDVADPVGGGEKCYADCFEVMKNALDNLFLDLDGIIAGLPSRKH